MSVAIEMPSDGPFLLGAAIVADSSDLDEHGEFALNESLLSQIRVQRRPVVISSRGRTEVYAEMPRRVAACLVLPCYTRERLTQHVVVFAGKGIGTFEVWATEALASPDARFPLCLSSGYFGALDEFFRLSTVTKFGWDEGLPGQAAARRDCVVFSDLGESTAFLRAGAAQSVGLSCGFAFPVPHPLGVDVATILLGTRDKQHCRLDTWAAETSVSHRQAHCCGGVPERQRALAKEVAEVVNETGTAALVRTGEGGSVGANLALGWMAAGLTSVPRILTVVI